MKTPYVLWTKLRFVGLKPSHILIKPEGKSYIIKLRNEFSLDMIMNPKDIGYVQQEMKDTSREIINFLKTNLNIETRKQKIGYSEI